MAAPAKNRVLAGERVSRAAIDAAVAAGAATPDAIRAAVAACDYDRAAVLAFARARCGDTLELDDIAHVIPGLELWSIACALIAIARGDRTRLLELLERRRFPVRVDSGELEAIALYAAWRAGAARERLIPLARRLSVRQMTVEGLALVATVGAALDDANVTAALKHVAATAKEHAAGIAETDRALARTLDQAIAALPAEVEIPDGGGFTVRAAKQVGRNDLCPCGSGQKFKKCCADKPAKSGSPIAGVSWDEFLTTAAGQMTPDQLADLALVDLVKVDLGKLQPPTLARALDAFLDAREWTHAERVLAVATGSDADALREVFAVTALHCGEDDRARPLIAVLPEPARSELALEIERDDAETWRMLAAAAKRVVASDEPADHAALAYALLHRAPELGIIAARACVGAAKLDDGELLLESVEDVRDRLNLPPGDPAWDVFDTIAPKRGKRGRGAKQVDESTEAKKLRETLAASAARADELEKSLAATRAALDQARTPTIAELQRTSAPAPGEARTLEGKVRELEALIREGNAERRDLRKQLSTTEAAAAPATAAPDKRPRAAAADDDDSAIADSLEPAARPLAIPRFERRAADSFRDVPAQVAAEAMRTVGTLAAGDGFAWRNVKQAKDMPRTVLMARVGIHHRLIMLSDGASLEIVDLVTREQLMTTLKRLRANL
jgi:hypothetical protein|nr:SEC-C metal-binding domain-containing protein [Kofleriaceae bacterium]